MGCMGKKGNRQAKGSVFALTSHIWAPLYKGGVDILERVGWRAIKAVRGWECLMHKERLRFVSTWRRIRGVVIPLLLPTWGLRRRWSWVLSELHNDSHKLQQEVFWVDLKKKPFTAGVVKCWNGLPREALESLSLEIFNPWQGKAPRNPIKFWSWPWSEKEVGPGDLQGPFWPNFFLWFCDFSVSFISPVEWKLCCLPLYYNIPLMEQKLLGYCRKYDALQHQHWKQAYKKSDFFHCAVLQSCCCGTTLWGIACHYTAATLLVSHKCKESQGGFFKRQ